MKNELSQILENFYDSSLKDEEKALTTILEMANSDPEKFIQIVREVKPDDIGIIYEALGKDMDHWNDFFLNEAYWILDMAKKSEKPADFLSMLDEYIFIDPEEFKHRDEFISMLKKELKHENPAFRYYAICSIADFMEEGDVTTRKLLENHLQDPNWRIRYWTYYILKSIKDSKKYKLSLLDNLRSKLFDSLKIN